MDLKQIVERLNKLDTCAVSDAMDALGLRGVVNGLRQMTVSKKIAGRAVTVKLAVKGPGHEVSKRHLGTAAVEYASEDDIIVVEHGKDDVAGWGGNLAIAAKARGIRGLVIDGACRDIDEMRAIDFPVYARSATPTTARGRIVEQSFNEPVSIAGIEVHPGDFVIADGSGVVFVPAAHIEDVLAAAERIVEKEALMAKAIREGQPVSQVMGQNYETMLERKS